MIPALNRADSVLGSGCQAIPCIFVLLAATPCVGHAWWTDLATHLHSVDIISLYPALAFASLRNPSPHHQPLLLLLQPTPPAAVLVTHIHSAIRLPALCQPPSIILRIYPASPLQLLTLPPPPASPPRLPPTPTLRLPAKVGPDGGLVE